jgi:hypothetical protein
MYLYLWPTILGLNVPTMGIAGIRVIPEDSLLARNPDVPLTLTLPS